MEILQSVTTVNGKSSMPKVVVSIAPRVKLTCAPAVVNKDNHQQDNPWVHHQCIHQDNSINKHQCIDTLNHLIEIVVALLSEIEYFQPEAEMKNLNEI